eukprot:841535-Pyramimonas_sp.AAC.1
MPSATAGPPVSARLHRDPQLQQTAAPVAAPLSSAPTWPKRTPSGFDALSADDSTAEDWASFAAEGDIAKHISDTNVSADVRA